MISNFKNFLNENYYKNSYAEKVEELLSAAEAATELINMSAEELSRAEFKEYVRDYCNNPLDYSIDINGKYYQAIVTAFENTDACYDEYVKIFHPWKGSQKLNDLNDKTGVFEK